MKIIINENCRGCGTCEGICEDIFQVKNGRAHIIKQEDNPCVDEAIEMCPEGAIEKVED